MNKFFKLLKVNFMLMLSQMNILGSNTKVSRKKKIWIAVGIAAIAVYLVAYLGMMAYMMIDALKGTGLEYLVLIMLFLIVTMLVFMSGLYSANSMLFESRDNEQLFSYPVPQTTIIASKVCAMLIANLLFSFIIGLPFAVIYAVMVAPPFAFYVFILIALLLLPLVPLALSSLVAYIISLLTSTARFRSFFNMFLTLGFVFGFVFGLQAVMTNTNLLNVDLVASLKIYYAPMGFLIAAFEKYSWLNLLIFIATSVIPFAILLLLMSVFYRAIWSKSQTVKRSKNKKIAMTQNKQIVTLIKKEFARFFSSPNYMLNSSIGVIMLTIASIASIFGSERILTIISGEAGLSLPVLPILIILAAFCMTITITTASSISLEGKSLFIAKTMPVDAKLIFLAKLICNWIVAGPLLFVNCIILAVVFKLGFVNFAILFFLPLAFSVLLSAIGLYANIKWHKFDWKSDYNAVKNSMSVLVTVLGGYAILLSLGLIYYGLASKIVSFEIFAAICFVLISAAAGALLYLIMKNSKKYLENL